MNTVTVPATLHCAGCIQSIKPFFNASPKVKDWKVDLSQPVKTITVSGDDVSKADVVSLLQQAGYDTMQVTEGLSSALPPIGGPVTMSPPSAATGAFWQDTPIWKRAGFNTFNCLIGCSIGDFGTIIFLQAFYPHTPMLTQMVLATINGLCTSVMLESVILKMREGFAWQAAFSTALSMSFISMVTMEVAMNISDFMVTGGKAAFNSPQYWSAFAIAAVAGFLAPLPYNYFKLKKYNKSCH